MGCSGPNLEMQEQALFALTTDQKLQILPLAVASLVLGIFSFTMFGIISGIPAVIRGHISLSKFDELVKSPI